MPALPWWPSAWVFLQIVLDKGQEDDWFSSPFITGCALLSGIGIAGAIIWQLGVSEAPIVDLPLMGDRSFLFTNFMMFSTLFILMSTTQILPQFVQQILPYDATHAGLTLMPGGLVIMALMPLVGFLVRKIQPKYLIAFGFLVMALALNDFGNFYGAISFQTIALARVFQGFGFAFLFVPIQTLALSDVPAGKSNNASALINLMRNLGGSVGISVATTCLARRSQVHQDRLAAHLTPTAIRYQAHVHSLAQRFSAHGADTFTAAGRALATMGAEMQTQAALLAYLDIFALLMFGSLFACLLTCFLKKVKPGRKPAH